MFPLTISAVSSILDSAGTVTGACTVGMPQTPQTCAISAVKLGFHITASAADTAADCAAVVSAAVSAVGSSFLVSIYRTEVPQPIAVESR